MALRGCPCLLLACKGESLGWVFFFFFFGNRSNLRVKLPPIVFNSIEKIEGGLL